jgi:hypothetical protein|tara:strand:+ start:723 stop:926 length:204 start_codon:yes stop_codon:yes gene_type:complete
MPIITTSIIYDLLGNPRITRCLLRDLGNNLLGEAMTIDDKPPTREYGQGGGRPGLNVDFRAGESFKD